MRVHDLEAARVAEVVEAAQRQPAPIRAEDQRFQRRIAVGAVQVDARARHDRPVRAGQPCAEHLMDVQQGQPGARADRQKRTVLFREAWGRERDVDELEESTYRIAAGSPVTVSLIVIGVTGAGPLDHLASAR